MQFTHLLKALLTFENLVSIFLQVKNHFDVLWIHYQQILVVDQSLDLSSELCTLLPFVLLRQIRILLNIELITFQIRFIPNPFLEITHRQKQQTMDELNF